MTDMFLTLEKKHHISEWEWKYLFSSKHLYNQLLCACVHSSKIHKVGKDSHELEESVACES